MSVQLRRRFENRRLVEALRSSTALARVVTTASLALAMGFTLPPDRAAAQTVSVDTQAGFDNALTGYAGGSFDRIDVGDVDGSLITAPATPSLYGGANGELTINFNATSFTVGNDLILGAQGTLNFNSASGAVGDRLSLVVDSGALLTIEDGASISFNGNGRLNIGVGVGAEGSGLMTGGSVFLGKTGSYSALNIGFTGTGDFTQTGGSVELDGSAFQVGVAGGIGEYNMSGGSFTLTPSSTIYLGETAGGQGTLNITGNAQFTTPDVVSGSGTQLFIGTNEGTGKIVQDGAASLVSINAGTNAFVFGYSDTVGVDGGVGSYELHAGTFEYSGTLGIVFGSSAGGTGTFTQTGGSFTAEGPVTIGGNGTGLYELSGGSAVMNGVLRIGYGTGSGAVIQSGTATAKVDGGIVFGAGSSSASYTLSGGSLTLAGGISGGNANSDFILNGGTLIAASGFTAASTFATSVDAASIVQVDDADNVIWNSPISGTGNLTKTGTGTLTLGGNNASYTGEVAINGGTVALTTLPGLSAQNDVNVAAGTTLDISAVPRLSGDAAPVQIGELSGSGTISVGNNALVTNIGTGATTAFSGTLIATNHSWDSSGLDSSLRKFGAGTLVIDGMTADIGNVYVAQGALSQTSDTTSIVYLAVGSSATAVEANNSRLNVSGGALNIAESLSVGDWGGYGTLSQTGGTVTITTGCDDLSHCASLNVGNQGGTGTYDISGGTLSLLGGSHAIGRNSGNNPTSSGELNISGDALVELSPYGETRGFLVIGDRDPGTQANSTGVINQTGGILRIANASDLNLGGYGSGTYNLDGGTLEIGGASLKGLYGGGGGTGSYDFNLGGGTIKVIGTALTTAVNAELVDGTNSTIDTNGFGATWSGVLSGTGNLIKAGAGTLTLSGAHTYEGITTINAGTLSVGASTNFGTGGLVFNGGTLAATGDASTGQSVTLQAGGGTFDVADVNETLTISGAGGAGTTITGAGGLTKVGAGTLSLNVTNGNGGTAYTGATNVNAGTLQAVRSNSLSSRSAFHVAGGAALRIDHPDDLGINVRIGSLADGTVGGVTSGGEVYIEEYSALTVGYDGTSTAFSGIITGEGDLTKTGAGVLTLTGGTRDDPSVVNMLDIRGTGAVVLSGGSLETTYGGVYVNDASSLTITNGGMLRETIGINGPSPVGGTIRVTGTNSVTGVASTMEAVGSIYVTSTYVSPPGTRYKGLVVVADGGVIIANGGIILHDEYTELRIGEGELAGTVTTGASGIQNNGTIRANFTDSTTLAALLTGSGAFTKAGSGVLTYSGDGSGFTGTTTVQGGRLSVNDALGGTIEVQSGGTLGGIGSVGATTVADGGILAPGNSPGTLTLESLVLNTGSRLDFELGDPGDSAASDHILVNGDLALSGVLDIDGSADFGEGTYELIGYGTMSVDEGLLIGTAPGGYNYTVDTGTNGEVNLVVDRNGLQFWNGTHTSADGTVYGGSGTWNAGSTNWTNAAGTIPSAWNSMTAVFGGLSGGTVTVAGTMSVAGLQFTTTGYTLAGGMLEISDPSTGLLADAGVTATIASTITGDGGLVKQGAGTVVLSGTNDFEGGTQILAGTLQVSADANLGAAAGELTLNGGTLATTASFDTGRGVTLTGSGTLAVASGTTLGLTGTVGGSGALIKQGAGTLALSGTNGYLGGTILAEGTVRVSADANLGALSGGLSFFGGTLATTASFDTARTVTLAGNGTFAVANGTTLGLTGLVTGPGALVKQGQGTLVLSGTVNDYIGGTDVEAGTLRLGAAGALPQFTAATIAGGATLDLNGYGAMFGSLQGSGTLAFGTGGATYLYSGGTFAGTFAGGDVPTAFIYADSDPNGMLTLSGNSSFGGYLVADSGHIVSTGNSSFGGLSFGDGTFEVAGGSTILDSYIYASGAGAAPEISITGGGALTITQGLYIGAYAGDVGDVLVSGAGSHLIVDDALFVSYEGTGSLTLAGGMLTLTAGGAPGMVELAGAPTGVGTLNIGAASGSAPTAPGVVQAAQVTSSGGAGTIVFNHTSGGYYFTDTGTASGTPVLITANTGEEYDSGQTSVVQEAGTTYLLAANTYTGMTTVNGGMLSIGNGGASGSIVGPATINAGGTLQFARADDTAYAGPLAGTGALIKAGAGTLNYTGNGSAFTGLTSIAAGTLAVNGTLGGPVDVLSGGTLGGNGTMGSVTVLSGGTAAPGNSVGTLNIAGDVTFNTGSTYEVELAASGSSDLIAATGQAILNGGIVDVVALDPQTSYQSGQSYTILAAQGGISGSFDAAVSDSPFLRVDLDDLLNSVGITIAVVNSFTTVALTPNQFATAAALDTLPQAGPELGLYNALLSLSSGSEARAAFDQLSGEAYASAQGLFIEQSGLIRTAMIDRLRASFGAVGASSAPVVSYEGAAPGMLAYAPPSGASPVQVAADMSMPVKAVTVPATTERFALWATGFGSWADMDGNGNAAGLSSDTGGFLIGADTPLADGWRIGVSGGYSYTSFDVSGRNSSGDSDNWHVGAYAGNQWGPLGLRTGLAYTWQDVETSRNVAFPGFADQLNGDYDAGTFQAFGELGYAFDVAFATFEPFVNLAYVRLNTDGFGEQGGAAALTVAGSDMDTTFTTLGLRASVPFQLGDAAARLRGMAGWRHAFGDIVPLTTQAFFGSDSFTVAGVPIAEDAAVLEAGLDVLVGASTTLGVAYTGQFGDGVTQNGFNATLKVSF